MSEIEEEEVSHRFKLILLGPGGVGKTSLLNRFVNNQFSEAYRLTIGVDFLSKDIQIGENELAKLTIWDIGGQERFKFMRSRFYAGASGALLVFDLTRAETYEEINRWLEELKHFAVKNCVSVFIGNKLDLLEDTGEVVDRATAKKFAEEEGSLYIETSAKTGENVEDAFIKLTNLMVDKLKK